MLKKILTKDGSYTLYNPDLKETFHSKNGALTESLHVYISEGLEYWIKNNSKVELCNIFEMGFGTGLNAILTNRFSKANQKKITYCSIDKFPLTNNQIKMVSLNDLSEIENYIINSSWNKTHKITSLFSLFKLNDDFLSIKNKQTYDVVFYDAFAYHAQPNIWSEKAIKISTDLLKKNGVWVSYCSKGIVRRILERYGLNVQRIPGPPGKREMLRAIKI
jgi:tRNA U34 5-methylaminomethyl-2-thiouridine-forming methyltransferase MnmC